MTLSHEIRHRRDVCFSQALTSLITGLMTKLWCGKPDQKFLTILVTIGPLVSFEGLLSLHGEDVAIFNDMIVAVEDLRNVEFTLILVDNKSKVKLRSKNTDKAAAGSADKNAAGSTDKSGTGNAEKKGSPIDILSYHSFPLPRVTGSRSSLKGLYKW